MSDNTTVPHTTKPAASAPDGDAAPAFEQMLNDLETIVGQLESGELALEESLAAFERGMTLSQRADAILASAEARIEVLMSGDDVRTTPFDGDGA
jgi:exodeoxyribonuclease VII small subunit